MKDRRRLKAHFSLTRIPFSKKMWARHMFDSGSQRELLAGLMMWTEVRGLALVTGASGVGKSITLRRFTKELSDDRFRIFDFTYLPTTVYGFLRSLARKLEIPLRNHTSDLFDAVRAHLATWEVEHGTHPVLLVDDAEGLKVHVLDSIRRLTNYELDGEDHVSILLAGTEDVLTALRHPQLQPLRTRFTFTHGLRAFGFEDTQNYVRHHLEHAQANPKLFTDAAVQRLFQASKGTPRNINQLATQAMITAATHAKDTIDGNYMQRIVKEHPLYDGRLER